MPMTYESWLVLLSVVMAIQGAYVGLSMAVQVGAHCLEKEQGGTGILLGGVPGVAAAKVVILGGGVAGTNAARVAMGMEAYVTVIDKSLPRLYELDLQFGSQLHTLFATVDGSVTFKRSTGGRT